MKKIEKTIYVTLDGKEFLDETDAQRHETNLKNIRYFVVHHTPNLTDTGNYTKLLHVAVHTENGCHQQILYQYLMKHLGWNAIQEGVQGYGYMSSFMVETASIAEFNAAPNRDRCFLSQIGVCGYPQHFNFVETWKEIIPKP